MTRTASAAVAFPVEPRLSMLSQDLLTAWRDDYTFKVVAAHARVVA